MVCVGRPEVQEVQEVRACSRVLEWAGNTRFHRGHHAVCNGANVSKDTVAWEGWACGTVESVSSL